jgi:hypothetical protein
MLTLAKSRKGSLRGIQSVNFGPPRVGSDLRLDGADSSRSGCQGVNIGLKIAGTDQSRSIDVD